MKTKTQSPQVALFVTCLVDLYRPNIGFAAIKLLEQAGCQVVVPKQQSCCGQPALNSGDNKNARDIAKQVIAAFSGFDYVVGPSGSCMATIKKHYPGLFQDEPEWLVKVQDLASRSHELLSFLNEVMKLDSLKASYAGRATYHDSCSGLRELGIKQQPRQLLDKVSGLTLDEMNNTEVCCGFGGTFCVKFPEISVHLTDEKINNIEQTGADVLLGGDLGCLLNISGRLKRLGHTTKIYHTAEVLADMAKLPGIADSEVG